MQLVYLVLSLSAAGSVLGLLLMAVTRLFGKKLPAAFFYYAWLLVLLRFLLPVPGHLQNPAQILKASPVFGHVVEAPQATPASGVSQVLPYSSSFAELEEREIFIRPHSINNPGQSAAFRPVIGVSSDAAAAGNSGGADTQDMILSRLQSAWRSGAALLAVWILGMLLTALLTFGGYFRFCRLLRPTLKEPLPGDLAVLQKIQPEGRPRLYRSCAITTPMLLGLLRPWIILPDRKFDDAMLEDILLHELTHYRRGDMVYKWSASLALLPHWFNPLAVLFRRELDRVCELSCDAAVLRRMGTENRKHYGEVLLSLAADRPLPGSVMAVSFATEKRNLKERLKQIMTYRKFGKTSLALMLALLLLLTGCATIVGPSQSAVVTQESTVSDVPPTPEPSPVTVSSPAPTPPAFPETTASQPETVVEVATVDEFLAAIGPDRDIHLADGVYNLTQAESYGQPVEGDYWYWESGNDGDQLRIFGVRNLRIFGGGAEFCNLVTEPRYATVLNFSGCENIELLGINIGHTKEQAYCSGGVLNFDSCTHVSVNSCYLFGCGTVGISASNTRDLAANNTVISDCTYGAIEAYSCRDVRFVDGLIKNCGISKDPENADHWIGFNLIHADTCSNFVLANTTIRGNFVQTLFSSNHNIGYQILGCEVSGNTVGQHDDRLGASGPAVSYDVGAVFSVRGKEVSVSGTSFADNTVNVGFIRSDNSAASPIVDEAGQPLDRAALEGMSRSAFPQAELDALFAAAEDTGAHAGDSETSGSPDSFREVHVTTADEFLDAIGDYTIIHVDAELLDFSTASNYGGYGTDRYYWADNYDGPGLVITGATGLYIIGQGKDQTTLQATPRYAEVLYFDSCRDICIMDLTAGHLREAPGSCSGDVLEFLYCEGVLVSNCGLFGCGVNGIVASNCTGFNISDTEIYECSWAGANLFTCQNFNFERCSIHDCGSNAVHMADCRQILWDELSLRNGENQV